MDYFVQWVKNIAIFYIISTLVQNLIPNDKYKRYIKLFLGIVMVILLVRPLGDLLGLGDNFENILTDKNNQEMAAELKAELGLVDEERSRIIVGEYTDKICGVIEEYVTGLGAYYIDADVEIDTDSTSDTFGTINSITVNVSRGSSYQQDRIPIEEIEIGAGGEDMNEELLSVRIKNYLSDFYNLSKRNIYVNIS